MMGKLSWSMVAGTAILWAAGPMAWADEIRVSVDGGKITHSVDPRFAGMNMCPLWNKTQDAPEVIKAFSQMNNKILRFPGGCPAEWWDWEHPTFCHMGPQDAWKVATFSDAAMMFQTNAFGEFNKHEVEKGQAKVAYDTSGDHTAAWAKFCLAQGIKVAYWEIGNEPECDAPDPIKKKGQDAIYKFYNDKFTEQAKAIKAVDSAAKIMGPAATNTYFWWHEKNLEKFLLAHGNVKGDGLFDAVSIHWYPEGTENKGWEKLRGMAQKEWPKRNEFLRGVMKTLDSRPLPLFVTEWNFSAGDKGNGPHAAKFFNALGAADMIGEFRDTGVDGQTFFVLQHINNNWGMIADSGEGGAFPAFGCAPTYYAITMANLLGPDVLTVTNSADPAEVLSAYASRTGKKQTEVMLVNKSDSPQTVALSISGMSLAGKKALVYTLKPLNGKTDDNKVIYNGAKAPEPATEKLPDPETMTLTASPKVTMEPYSLVVLLIPGG